MIKLGSIFNNIKNGLEARMTFHIVTTVIIVSLIMTAIAASMYETKYEQELNDELDKTIDITEKIIDIEVSKIETAAFTAAQLYDDDAYDKRNIDSILTHSLMANPSQVATTVILDSTSRYKERLYAVVSNNGEVSPVNLSQEGLVILKDDDNWRHSYINKEKYWSLPYSYTNKDSIETQLVSYSIPITNPSGKVYGIYCSSISLDWLSDQVIESKTSDDIDVTIVADDGNYIVPPGDFIKGIPDDELIIKKNRINRLGWNFIFYSPRSIINHCVWKAVIKIIAFEMLLIIILCISIVYNVKHVARPFVNEQKKIARDKASMDKEVTLAADLQRKLLTDDSISQELFNLHASLEPAKNIGGDLYDYTVRDNTIFFCIGDVSGKGMAASLFMAMTTVLFRHTINEQHINSPSEIVTKINHSLALENSECMFVTFFVGILDLASGTLAYCNAGHNAPMVNDNFINGESGMPMGIDSDSNYVTCTLKLKPGDTILLYTDGVTEAINHDNAQFGEQRLSCAINQSHGKTAQETVDTIISSLNDFVGDCEQFDDITLLCVNYKGKQQL